MKIKEFVALLQENKQEFEGSGFLSSMATEMIKKNCLVDFKRLVARLGDDVDLPKNIKDAIEEPVKNNDDFNR